MRQCMMPRSLPSLRISLLFKRQINITQSKSGSINLPIPMKVVSDSDLIPVTHSDVKPITVGAKRRWRCYRA
jgi:hypothetical protein